jgi:hypothetical protein
VIQRIEAIVNAPHFPSTQHPTHHLLNCFRLLTRIMPYIFESHENAEWEDHFFWTPRTVERQAPGSTSQEQQIRGNFGEEGGQGASEAVDSSSPSDQKRIAEYDTLKPRGELLLTRKFK